MICPRCLFRTSLPTCRPHVRSSQPSRFRLLSTSLAPHAEKRTSSSSVADFLTPPPHDASTSPADTKGPAAESIKQSHQTTTISSVPAGTPLKGLNYFKNRPDPVAMEDHEYPEWLWSVLSDGGKKGAAVGAKQEVDPRLFSKSAHARQKANKRARKAKAVQDTLAPQIPLYEQSVDLPSGDGTSTGAAQALDAREELTRAMRGKRRRDIKEANFLKAMQ